MEVRAHHARSRSSANHATLTHAHTHTHAHAQKPQEPKPKCSSASSKPDGTEAKEASMAEHVFYALNKTAINKQTNKQTIKQSNTQKPVRLGGNGSFRGA